MSITPIGQIISRHICYIYTYLHDTVIKNSKFYSRKKTLNTIYLPDISYIFKIKLFFLSKCTFVFDEENESRKKHLVTNLNLLELVICNLIYFVISSMDLIADSVLANFELYISLTRCGLRITLKFSN